MYCTARKVGFWCCDQCHTELFHFYQLVDFFKISQFNQKYLASILLIPFGKFVLFFKALLKWPAKI